MVTRVLSIGRNLSAPRGQRLRQALERLGPIFVKFGQVLSTRRDLMPLDIADELAKLQDRVPPFDSAIAIANIEKSFRKPLAEIFISFDEKAHRQRIRRASAFCDHTRQRGAYSRSCSEGFAPRYVACHRKRPEFDAHDGRLG